MKKSLYFAVLTMFFIPFLLIPKSDANTSNDEIPLEPLENNTSYKIDTTNWKTVPIGRYLIKLPQNAQVDMPVLRFSYGYFGFGVDYIKSGSLEKARASLKEEEYSWIYSISIFPYSDEEYAKRGIEYYENFGFDGSLLVSFLNKENSIYTDGAKCDLVFASKRKNEIHSHSPNENGYYAFTHRIYGANDIILEDEDLRFYQEKQLIFLKHLANNIYYADKNTPLETKTGIYFKNAFFEIGDINDFALPYERSGAIITFPEYPHLELEIYFSHVNTAFSIEELFNPKMLALDKEYFSYYKQKQNIEKNEEEKYEPEKNVKEEYEENKIDRKNHNKHLSERLSLAENHFSFEVITEAEYKYPPLSSKDSLFLNKMEVNTKIAGRNAEEILTTYTKNGIKNYLFTLFANEIEEQSFEKPYISMTLSNSTFCIALGDNKSTVFGSPDLDSPSIPSDEEALAFWNAIKESIRWRPDGWIVPLPEEAEGKPYFIVNEKIVPAE